MNLRDAFHLQYKKGPGFGFGIQVSGSDQKLSKYRRHFVTWLRSSLDRTGLTKDHGLFWKKEVVLQSTNNVLKQPWWSSCRPFEIFESSYPGLTYDFSMENNLVKLPAPVRGRVDSFLPLLPQEWRPEEPWQPHSMLRTNNYILRRQLCEQVPLSKHLPTGMTGCFPYRTWQTKASYGQLEIIGQ